MPLLLGYFAYSLASGLALYFFISNLLAIVQAAAMKRLDWRGLLTRATASLRRTG
jgi:YidC/Oxa1 family membrane protein insertase